MLLYLIAVILIIFVTFIIVRAAFEFVRFCFELFSLSRKLKKLDGDGVKIEYVRKFSKIAFGDKGKTDFLVKTKNKTYDITVLSFPTVRGRWNIEKVEDRYYAEVRVYNNMFFLVYNNTGTEPQHAKDYRRETRIARKRLHLSPEKGEGEKILLICPKPKALTYTDYKFEHICSGDKVFGYRVLFEDDFLEKFKK